MICFLVFVVYQGMLFISYNLFGRQCWILKILVLLVTRTRTLMLWKGYIILLVWEFCIILVQLLDVICYQQKILMTLYVCLWRQDSHVHVERHAYKRHANTIIVCIHTKLSAKEVVSIFTQFIDAHDFANWVAPITASCLRLHLVSVWWQKRDKNIEDIETKI